MPSPVDCTMYPSYRRTASIISFSAGSTIARASSGSRSCSSSVEPLISANSAVTVLRSPSSASGELLSAATRTPRAKPGSDGVAAAAPAPFVSRVPHLPQKSDVGGFSALHFAHCFASASPHFAQKLLVDGLFVPHFEQRIELLESRDRPFLYHPLRREKLRTVNCPVPLFSATQ